MKENEEKNSEKKESDEMTLEQDDIVPEEDSDHARGGEVKGEVLKLKEKLKESEKQKQEYLDGWQRAQADFVNLRKKDEERLKEVVAFANQDLILEIIPVLDSFDIAFSHKESWEKVSKDWRMGVESIYSQLLTVLKNNGIVQLNPLGQPFNLGEEEAIQEVEVDDPAQEGKVTNVVSKGYKLKDRLIRSAKVWVGIHKK